MKRLLVLMIMFVCLVVFTVTGDLHAAKSKTAAEKAKTSDVKECCDAAKVTCCDSSKEKSGETCCVVVKSSDGCCQVVKGKDGKKCCVVVKCGDTTQCSVGDKEKSKET